MCQSAWVFPKLYFRCACHTIPPPSRASFCRSEVTNHERSLQKIQASSMSMLHKSILVYLTQTKRIIIRLTRTIVSTKQTNKQTNNMALVQNPRRRKRVRLNAAHLTLPLRADQMRWTQKQKWIHARTLHAKPQRQDDVFPGTTSSIMLFLITQYRRNPTKSWEHMAGIGWFGVWAEDRLDKSRVYNSTEMKWSKKRMWEYARTHTVNPVNTCDTFPGTTSSIMLFLINQYRRNPTKTLERMKGIAWFDALIL